MEGNEDIREVMHSYAKRPHEAPAEQPGFGTGPMSPESPGGSVLNESVLLNFIEETLRRLAAVEATAHENTQSIQSFAVSLELIGKKVEHGARKSNQLQNRVVHLEQERTGHQQSRAHLDAHEQKWNLDVSGMQEKEGENVRQLIIDLFSAVCPQIAEELPHAVGLVHRLGARTAARARCVRVRFNALDHRARIWKSAKTSELLKQLNIQITEDRSEGDDQVRKEADQGHQVQTQSTRSRTNKARRTQEHQDQGAPEDVVTVQIKDEDQSLDCRDAEEDEDDSTESGDTEGDTSTQSSEEDSKDKEDDTETESEDEVLERVDEFIEDPVNSVFKEEIKEHQETQSDQEEHQHRCLVCGKTFSRSFHLKAHQVTHTGKKTYFCPECGKSFTQLTNLKTHQRIHTGEKPYRCSDCGRSFTHSATLISHQRIHTGEKPYQCSYCGRRFSQSINLKTHQRIHTGEKPYQCTDCDKAYAHLSTLITHRRVHTGEKPYQCSQCGKRFSQSINLKTHQRIHTGEKPYQCTECGKKYSHLTTFLSHQRIHTGERPYRCATCGVSFSRSSTLSNHLKIHDGGSLRERPRARAGLNP